MSLPCNITAGEWNEAHISLVVWYRSGNQGNPIYSIDARNSLTTSRHQVTPELNGRVRMDFNTRPPVLHIDSVMESDAGDYRCRVDYRMNRTQQFLIHLNVSGKSIICLFTGFIYITVLWTNGFRLEELFGFELIYSAYEIMGVWELYGVLESPKERERERMRGQ